MDKGDADVRGSVRIVAAVVIEESAAVAAVMDLPDPVFRGKTVHAEGVRPVCGIHLSDPPRVLLPVQK